MDSHGRSIAELLGLLKVRVVRGSNLAFRDTMGSDPYVVLRMGRQVRFPPFSYTLIFLIFQDPFDFDLILVNDHGGWSIACTINPIRVN